MNPLIASLKRQKLVPVLIAAQVAITIMFLANAGFSIQRLVSKMILPTGLDTGQLMWFSVRTIDGHSLAPDQIQEDLQAIRGTSGITAVALVSTLPLSGVNPWRSSVGLSPDAATNELHEVTLNLVSDGSYEALKPHIVLGRWFSHEEYVTYDPFAGDRAPPSAIITRSLANKLWPGQEPLGRQLYLGGPIGSRIIGVLSHYLGPTIESTSTAEDIVIFPASPKYAGVLVARCATDVDSTILHRVTDSLYSEQPSQLISNSQTLKATAIDFFRDDRQTAHVIAFTGLALLTVTGLGLMGLCTYWCHQRSRVIGIKRALGATRGHVLRYFLLENVLVVSSGVLLGCPLAILLNLCLKKYYELPTLPVAVLLATSGLLVVVGQLAVASSAIRASAIPPTRALVS